MNEVFHDLWTLNADAICITTNGTVKKNGRGVMGAGCAREARDRYPDMDLWLGQAITEMGNHVQILYDRSPTIISFPVKHDWWEKADLSLIRQSCRELVDLVSDRYVRADVIALPRPGCGNGGLQWEQVKPAIEPLLPDNVLVVTFPRERVWT